MSREFSKVAFVAKLEELVNMTSSSDVELLYDALNERVDIRRCITVTTNTGDTEEHTEHVEYVNVACDSNLALARDVLRANYFK